MSAEVIAAAAVAMAVLFARPWRFRPSQDVRWHRLVILAAALAPLALLWWVQWRHLAGAAIAVGATVGVWHLARQQRRRRLAQSNAAAVVEACQAMAADLQAGATPRSSLQRAAGDFALLEPVAAAAEVDADVPEALRVVAEQPGCAELRLVAAAWQVTHRAGAGLAPALATTATTLRERRATSRLVASELASARATGWLMALLPVAVILLGSGLGGDPLHFLLDTPLGLGCLGAGLALTVAGWMWIDRLAADVVRS